MVAGPRLAVPCRLMSSVLRPFVLVLIVGAFLAGLVVAWYLASPAPSAGGAAISRMPEQPRIEGDFTLLDPQGRPVPWREIRGRPQLVFFGFTHCPEACPTTLLNASQALADLGAAAADLRIVLISVDPQRDTPQAVGGFVANFGPQVTGYTGDAAGIAAAAAAFHVFYEKMPPPDGGDYMVNHTATLFLLGSSDEILEIIPYGATPTEIAAAVRRHL